MTALLANALRHDRLVVGYALLMFFMWWVMMVAMMLPAAMPVILLAAALNLGDVFRFS